MIKNLSAIVLSACAITSASAQCPVPVELWDTWAYNASLTPREGEAMQRVLNSLLIQYDEGYISSIDYRTNARDFLALIETRREIAVKVLEGRPGAREELQQHRANALVEFWLTHEE